MQRDFEFTFKFVGTGETEEQALRDAIESISCAITNDALEPTNVEELDQR